MPIAPAADWQSGRRTSRPQASHSCGHGGNAHVQRCGGGCGRPKSSSRALHSRRSARSRTQPPAAIGIPSRPPTAGRPRRKKWPGRRCGRRSAAPRPAVFARQHRKRGGKQATGDPGAQSARDAHQATAAASAARDPRGWPSTYRSRAGRTGRHARPPGLRRGTRSRGGPTHSRWPPETSGPAAGLHARDVVTGLRMREFCLTVQGDGDAGVLVRVDQRGQRGGGVEDQVQNEAQLGSRRDRPRLVRPRDDETRTRLRCSVHRESAPRAGRTSLRQARSSQVKGDFRVSGTRSAREHRSAEASEEFRWRRRTTAARPAADTW